MSNETELIKQEQTSSIKEKDIPENEKLFLIDTSAQTVWMKTKSGKDFCQMNMIRALAQVASPLFEKLKHEESMELFDFRYIYYDATDTNGNKIPDGIGRVYRYPKGSNSGGSGKSQFIPKRTKDVEVIPFRKKKEFLAADPNHHWKLVGHEYHQSDIPEEREMLLIFEWVENIPR